jgi:polysaccharide biosynthesis transport protein
VDGALGVCAGGRARPAYTFTATPIFEARTQLLLEVDNPNVVSFKEVVEQGQANTDYYQTQYRILQSRSLVRRTLDRERLWEHPLFRPKPPSAVVQALGGAAAWVGGLFGGGRAGAAGPRTRPRRSRWPSIASSKGLSVSPIRNSRLVDVKFRSPDPKLSARVANGLAAAFIEQNTELKFNVSKEASDWLGEQLAEQRKKVEASEQALQRYREQTDSVALEDRQNIVVQKLADVNAAVTKAKTERIQKEALYKQVKAVGANAAALDTLPSVLSNGFIQQLKAEVADHQRQYAQARGRFGPKHPDMVKLQSSIQTSEQKLRARSGRSCRRSRTTTRRRSRRNAASWRRSSRRSGRRSRSTGRASTTACCSGRREQPPDLREPAPTDEGGGDLARPADGERARRRPRRGAAPAGEPAHGAEPLPRALRRRSSWGSAAPSRSSTSTAASRTPRRCGRWAWRSSAWCRSSRRSRVTRSGRCCCRAACPRRSCEAFRAIRTNVLFSSAEEGLRTVVVTSARPGEGKSVVASNLAEALAQTGQRVLLVDSDMRRPRVHRIFRVPQEPGLSNLLVGGATPRECVHAGPVDGLWIMPAGTLPPNPAELLGSKRFKSFVGSLSKHFDWVVFDAPPVMAVTDASITAHLASGVVFVIGAESTAPGRRAALAQLKAAART